MPALPCATGVDGVAAAATIAERLLSGQFVVSVHGEPDQPEFGTTRIADTRVAVDTATTGAAAIATQEVIAPLLSNRSGLVSQPSTAYFRTIARIGAQVADALAYAHAQGICHRDIKPSNLLLDACGTVWVADFGLAKAENSEGDGLTHTGDIVGTLRYMAPERFNGWADAGSDNYALGVTLYEMLTLRPAFVESDRLKLIDRISNGAVRTPRSIDARIPNDLETIVLKAMARETSERYLSARRWPKISNGSWPTVQSLHDGARRASGLAVVPPQSRPCGTHLAGRDADDAGRDRLHRGRARLDPSAGPHHRRPSARHSSRLTSPQEPSARSSSHSASHCYPKARLFSAPG